MNASRTASLAVAILWLNASHVLAQNPKPPTLTDSPECNDCVTLVYNPVNGNLSVTVAALDPDDQDKLTNLELHSLGALFGPELRRWCREDVLDFPITCSNGHFGRHRGRGFGSFEIGDVLPTRLCGEDLVADLIVDGLYLTGGTLDRYNPDSPFLYVVPEPSAAIFGLVAVVGLLRRCRLW